MPSNASDAHEDAEQSHSLLADDGNNPNSPPEAPRRPLRLDPPLRRHSALHKPNNDGSRTPRTPNRVRFELEDEEDNGEEQGATAPNGHAYARGSRQWVESEDYFSPDSPDGLRSGTGQRAPLLTGIEAPSVTIANELDFNAEDYLETARPKSGMKSAFLNMANSIM